MKNKTIKNAAAVVVAVALIPVAAVIGLCAVTLHGARTVAAQIKKAASVSTGCECDIPNAGLPLTGDGTCRVCRRTI
jgi:hypothetical protein